MSKTLNKSAISDLFTSTNKSVDPTNSIENKKAEKNIIPDKKPPFEKNVGKFVGGLFVNILAAFLFFYFGASIISYSKYYLINTMGGKDPNKVPYVNVMSAPAPAPAPAPSPRGSLPRDITGKFKHFYNMIFGLNKWRFPYKNYFTESKDGIMKSLVSWVTESMAFSFANGRKSIELMLVMLGSILYSDCSKTDINSCKPKNVVGEVLETLAIICIPLISILLTVFPIIPVILGIFTAGSIGFNMFSNIEKVALKIPLFGQTGAYIATFLIGLIFLYSWVWLFFILGGMGLTIGISYITQYLLLGLFFFIGPLLQQSTRKNIVDLCFKKIPLIGLLVFGFLIKPAFDDLGKTAGWGFAGTTIGFAILTILSLFTEKH
jgi:hypothetical protein